MSTKRKTHSRDKEKMADPVTTTVTAYVWDVDDPNAKEMLDDFMEQIGSAIPKGAHLDSSGDLVVEMTTEKETPPFSFWNVVAPDDLEKYFDIEGKETKSGTTYSYDWNVEHWGTKWDAEMLDVEMEYDESTEERKVHYTFTTPWVPPIPFFKALVAKWPELTFSIIWEQYGYDGDDHGAEYDGSNGILEEINSW